MALEQKVRVALVAGGRAPDTLTYAVPEDLPECGAPGTVVTVPLGSRLVSGIVLGPADPEDPAGSGRLRKIRNQIGRAAIPPHIIELASWASRYYRAPEALLRRALLPPDARRHTRQHILPLQSTPPEAGLFDQTIAMGPIEDRLWASLPTSGLSIQSLRSTWGSETNAAIQKLKRQKRIRVEEREIAHRQPALPVRACPEFAGDLKRAPRQQALFQLLQSRYPHAVSRTELLLEDPGVNRSVTALLARGAIVEVSETALVQEPEIGPTLRREQQVAVEALENALGRFEPFLLFGITGSGKTEVHLRAAQAVRARGESVLLLVPEIGLTPQLVAQANARFPGEVAVLHSALSDNERARTWHAVAAGDLSVVIGPRSAVFAPVRNLGLIVVDEEHDAAYKQEELPRYQGRDVAVMRAKLADCPVVLASATPSLESWQNAQSGRYQLLELTTRANEGPLPVVRLVDMRVSGKKPPQPQSAPENPLETPAAGAFSPELEQALLETYAAGEQSLLFLNRRGWTRFLQCDGCGYVDICPDCSVSLTIHRRQRAAICHHCGFARPPQSRCPECRQPLASRSFGTEQIEASLHQLLPGARIARLDKDTGSKPGFLQKTVDAWRAGSLDVLIGTQMIAKGHDAPGVTLIGVLLADASLHFPDFRAAEKTFQLLAQVAGRAGRGDRPGRVLIQTRQPEHPSLNFALEHDFRGFAAGELTSRAALAYPPFGRLVRVIIEGPAEESAKHAERVAHHLRRAAGSLEGVEPGEVMVLGPAPAPIERLRGRDRHQILIKGKDAPQITQTLARARLSSGTTDKTRTIIDVDPAGML